MPTLYLLRHAKSSWAEPDLRDHERPLARRGRDGCARLNRYCTKADIAPALVLCSTAVRTRETLALVLPDAPNVQFEAALYHAAGAVIAARIHTLEGETAMLVGHNPGLQEALLGLARPSSLRRQAAEKLPTGALATLELDAWEATSGELVGFVVPRDL